MRVFITGATGFLGGALARVLAAEGAEVHALVRPASDHRRALEALPITWREGDVTVAESLSGLFNGAEWVIHAAGRLGQPGVSAQVFQRINVDGTRNVMAAALATESRPRVLHLSSTGILGPTGPDEAAENAPYAPTNVYERSKAAAEAVALAFAAKGLHVVVARPGFIYGPGDRHGLGLFRAIRDGRFFYIDAGRHLFQPTFVADAVAGMLACLRRGSPGDVYHIVGPRAVALRVFVTTIADALGVRQPRWSLPRWLAMAAATSLEAVCLAIGRHPPLGRTAVALFSEGRVFSWQKAHDDLGYTPVHDIGAGVSATVTWYREHTWL